MTATQSANLKPKNQVEHVDPATVQDWIDRGEAIVIDVREPFEHKAEHLAAATNVPLGKVGPDTIPEHAGKKLVVHCKSGMRSQRASESLAKAGVATVYNLKGGIDAWKAANLPVESSGKAVLDVQRQVFIIVGSLVVIGSVLAIILDNPWWALMAALPGAGLLNAGISGLCPLAKLLGIMPWNRV
jgi:rhodanese-related sulfurtransferase